MANSKTYNIYFEFDLIPPVDELAWHILRDRLEDVTEREIDDDLPIETLRFYAGFYETFPDLFPPKPERDQKKPPKGLYLGPLTESISVLSLPMKLVEKLVPFALELARSLRATAFDPTTGHIHRSDGYAGIQMTVEGESVFISPNADQTNLAIDSMTPDGGPSTLILDAKTGDYAQVAGGDGQFTCEWREYDDASFQHWVAGRGVKATRDIEIPTNGYHVVVKSNERLSAADVTSILKDFAEGKPRSNRWQWRNITDQFQKKRT